MKAVLHILRVALCCALALVLLSCVPGTSAKLSQAEQDYSPDYAVAVIRTSSYEHSSFIDYYDGSLKLVASVAYPYAGLDISYNGQTSISNGKVFLVPRGLAHKENDRKVISIDFETGKVREYGVDLVSIDFIAVDQRYLYASNNLNGVGHIARVDIETGDVIYADIGRSAWDLYADGTHLFVFWRDYDRPANITESGISHYYLSRLGTDLNVLETLELTDDIGVNDAASPATNGSFYFQAVPLDQQSGSPIRPPSVHSYSMKDGAMKELFTPPSDIYNIMPHGDVLFVTYVGLDSNNRPQDHYFIDAYSAKTGELLSTIQTDYIPYSGFIQGDTLYISGDNGFPPDDMPRQHFLVKYRIDGSMLTEEARALSPYPRDDHHYYSALFCRQE